MANQSEVARLRGQIEAECKAMQQGMTGFAQSAAHRFIQQKYENLGATQQQLAQIVGEEEATNFMTETYIKTMG